MIMIKQKFISLITVFSIIILIVVLNHTVLVSANDDYYGENSSKEPSIHERNNIFFILIDALRPDHLGCYGYERDTSPNIDRIASQGVRFTNFYTVSPWTNPTIASLFSGRYPQAIFPPIEHKYAIRQVFPKEIDTLAEVLSREGYHTIALVDHPGITQSLNYNQGFSEFVPLFNKRGYHHWKGSCTSDIMKDLGEQLDKIKKEHFFIYLDLINPHEPYIPPPPYNQIFREGFEEYVEAEKQGIINMYDGEIRYTDELIGNIFDNLRKRKLLNNTYVIITADHGEGFWEHGLFGHGNSLYNELLKVPLIIYLPGGRTHQPEIVDELASNIDLFPTIMDFAKIENYPEVDGKSLLRYFKKGLKEPDQMIFSQSPHSNCIKEISCQNKRYKFILILPSSTYARRYTAKMYLSLNFIRLYDLRTDPLEKRNLAFFNIPTTIKMGIQLIRHKIINDRRRKKLQKRSRELDKDSIEKLKSLGYLQ